MQSYVFVDLLETAKKQKKLSSKVPFYHIYKFYEIGFCMYKYVYRIFIEISLFSFHMNWLVYQRLYFLILLNLIRLRYVHFFLLFNLGD